MSFVVERSTRGRKVTEVAQLGIASPASLRRWVRQAEVDRGLKTGPTSEELAEIKALRKEVADQQRTVEILKAATTYNGTYKSELVKLHGRWRTRPTRVHNHRVDRLVQRGPPPPRDRRHPTSRARSRLVPSQPDDPRGRHHLNRTAREPG
jgi:transposase-like protein